MILRLAAAGAIHGAAGVAMGVTGVLAACTVARTVQHGLTAASRGRLPEPPMAYSPPSSVPPSSVPPSTGGTP